MNITVDQAANILAAGGMVIVTDHEDRENEGDLVCAARFATPELINFMARQGRGLICCALEKSLFDRAGLKLLETAGGPGAIHGCRFGTPIDAINGCTTGISAYDRSVTIKRLVAEDCSPDDFARPGHMFPILEAEGGLSARQGHTEASVYLTRHAGLEGAAVICEMMDDDGHMVRGSRIRELADEWNLGVLSVKEIAAHLPVQEPLPLATHHGEFQMDFLDNTGAGDGEEHFCLFREKDGPAGGLSAHPQGPLVRIHSECLTGDLLGSRRCDCGAQLDESLRQISTEEEGYLIYLRQEGRGIGLRAKMKAYRLQDQGQDTLQANLSLGFPADSRDYGMAAAWLRKRGIRKIRLLSNNPEKITQLEAAGLRVTRVPLLVGEHRDNRNYIKTKQERMGHLTA